MHLAKTCLAACALLAASVASAQASLIVDDFSVTDSSHWPFTLPPNSYPTGPVDVTPTVLLGGRTVFLGPYSPPNPSLMQPSMAIYTPPGGTHNVFEVATPNNYRAYITLNYFGYTRPQTPVDLSAYSAVVVHVDSYDLPDGQPLYANVSLLDDSPTGVLKAGAYASLAATSGDLVLPFPTAPAFDPSTVYDLVVALIPAAGGDLRISSVTAVPEPATLLLPAASLALGRRRRPV